MASIRARQQKSGATSWSVLWRDPESGKQTSMTFDRESDAQTLKRLLDANGQRFAAAEQLLESAKSTVPTVADMLERHINLLTRPNEGTLTRYRNIVRQHINPVLGSVPVDSVDDEDIAVWVKSQTADGAARKSVANRMGLLSSAFKTAVRKGWCGSNPCEPVALPEDQRPGTPTTFLTRAEYDVLRESAAEKHRLILDVLVGTGIRFGEATALTWNDLILDAETPFIRVDKAWRTIDTWRQEVRSPKSKRSIRDVSITSTLANALKSAPRSDEYVFSGSTGGQFTSSAFHKQVWKPALAGAGDKMRKDPRPHDLRHTHASWLLAQGVPIFIVSRRLGHASTEITTRVYGHIMPSAQKDAVAAMERALVA